MAINNISVSVIMPAYNASNYIVEAIASVVAQTYSDWELIIVDDGSTDNTAQKAHSWLEQDSRIQYYYQENGKQGKARNLGISKSKGEYIAFLDADDIWMPEKLEIQIQEIKENNVDLVFSDSYVFNNDNVSDRSRKMNTMHQIFKEEEALKLFLEGNRIPMLTVFVKKEKIIFVNGFTEKKEIPAAEDYHLWLKLIMSGCCFYGSDKILASYRVHSESSTSKDKWASKQIPDVFYDLIQLYPVYQNQIRKELKLKFIYIYKNNLFTKYEMSIWIVKNSLYLSKSFKRYFYLSLNLLLPTKVTKRVLIYILNG